MIVCRIFKEAKPHEMFLQELKMALGGRVKHLEVELAKSERAREELRGKKEAEMLQVRHETSKQKKPQLYMKSPLFSCLDGFPYSCREKLRCKRQRLRGSPMRRRGCCSNLKSPGTHRGRGGALRVIRKGSDFPKNSVK